ncbi:DUF222 domain-containing protein [Mycobacterium sp. Aquia_216]|uniref:DUF222 domain-containing protein n=1 Tax=Mycobacterium sp. Aquia_216 TaxID=2991729 RepID=UPI003FA3A2DA
MPWWGWTVRPRRLRSASHCWSATRRCDDAYRRRWRPPLPRSHRRGKGVEHGAVIRRFYHRLPGWADADTRAHAEADLARQASQYQPDQLIVLAERLADCLNPDGNFTDDDDRAHRRGVTLGNQQAAVSSSEAIAVAASRG